MRPRGATNHSLTTGRAKGEKNDPAMSLFSLTSLAIARDIAGRGEPVPWGRPGRLAVAQAVSEAAARRGAAAAVPGQPTPIHADPSGSTTGNRVKSNASIA